MPNAAADIFRQAAKLNLEDPTRRGNVVYLDEGLEVVIAGDIHGNRQALTRVITYAALDSGDNRRLVLQEVLHGPPDERTGYDRSVEMLLRIARLKIAHGSKVVFLLANHDLAQATGGEITKGGLGACQMFNEGVVASFGDDADEVLEAISEFCLSMPLAARCANGVMLTHTLPSPIRMNSVDLAILDREYRPEDMERGGSLYEWTWGRSQTDEQINELAEKLGLEFFLLGHRHLETGWEPLAERAVSITSNHSHGCVVRFSTDEPLTLDNFLEHVQPIAGLGRPH